MLIKLGIQNFQAITKAKLEFGNGLTVITGASGSGKTAIMRALRCLVGNPSTSKQYIQDGKTETAVAVLIEGFKRVDWRRTSSSSAYVLGNSEVFSKTGRTQLHGVYPEFPLKMDADTGRVVNFLTEWDVLFPFDYTPAALFVLFESIFKIEDTRGILEEMKKDEAEAKAAEAAAQNLKAQLVAKQSALKKFSETVVEDTVAQHLLAYRHTRDQVGAIGDSLTQVATLSDYVGVGERVRQLDVDFSLLEGAFQLEWDVKEVGADERLLKVAGELSRFVGDFTFQEELRVMSWEAEVVAMEGCFLLAAEQLKRSELDFSGVEGLPEMEEAASALRKAGSFIGVASALVKGEFQWEAFSETFLLEREVEDLKLSESRLSGQLVELGALVTKRDLAQAALDEVATCPLCGSDLTKGHRHE